MKRIKDIRRFCISAMLILAASCNISAQNVNFTAAASANKIGLKDAIQVTYTIRDAQNLRSIAPVSFDDFDILQGPFQSNSSSIQINGNQTVQSTSVTLTYIVRPKHTGKLTIPADMAKDAAGHTYQSNSLNIQVVPGSLAGTQQRGSRQPRDPFGGDPFGGDPFAAMQQRQMQRMRQLQQMQQQQQQEQAKQAAKPVDMKALKKDIFIKVSVDKHKVHVGEQITASYKLYARIPMQMAISKLPSLNGFWTQDFDIPHREKPTEEIVNGKKYQVFLLKKSALFPQQTGTLELDPAEADGVARIIQQVRQRNPFGDMFDDPAFQNAFGSLMMNDPLFNNSFFNSVAFRDVKVHIKSDPVKIEVTPLPTKNQPKDYGGAVGNFNIAAQIDKNDISTDGVATLKVTITGSGNLKLIQAPKLDLPNGLETFDPIITDTITGRSNTISGSKIITYTITPHTPGNYTIAAIPFSYFDPNSNSYVSVKTNPIQFHVSQGKHYTPAIANNNNTTLTDIHKIENAPLNKLSFEQKPILFTPVYWSIYGVPFLAFIGLIFWKRRQEELSKDTVLLRSRRANKIALKRLVTAQALLKQNKEKPFYEEVSKAIWLYLSDKLTIPLSELSRERAQEALSRKNVPDQLQQKLEHIISECETALYAPMGGAKQMNNTYQAAAEAISELEETI